MITGGTALHGGSGSSESKKHPRLAAGGREAIAAPIAWVCCRDSWACPGREPAHQSPAPLCLDLVFLLTVETWGEGAILELELEKGGPSSCAGQEAAVEGSSFGSVHKVLDGAVLKHWEH